MLKKIASFLQKDVRELVKVNKQKEEVPESSVNLHNQFLAEMKVLASVAKTLDNPSFKTPDFGYYLEIKSNFLSGSKGYEGLNDIVELMSLAVSAQASFQKMAQIELRYLSSKQQEYYNFVFLLLEEMFGELPQGGENQNSQQRRRYDRQKFLQKIQEKLEEITHELKTEEGRQALAEYKDCLESLAGEKEFGLKLLYLFKRYNFTEFAPLRTISDMMVYLQDKNVKNMKAMEDLVEKNQHIFVSLGRIIGLPRNRENTETYGKMLQYLVLESKHENTIQQFMKMMEVMKSWKEFYGKLLEIRSQYPESEYQLPPEFKKEIPGLSIYEDYEKYIRLFEERENSQGLTTTY